MEALQTLGLALGFATLAGLNLYLTVFAAGLAIQQGWLDVSQSHPELMVLGEPTIVVIAGILYALEFFADKVPWVDSLWDAVHTFIRPIGGALLAVAVLGRPEPVFDVVAALLAGSVTLLAHTAKAGTRLVANHSPEPFSNMALSFAGDVTVLGGLVLLKEDPLVALFVFAAVLASFAYFLPKLWRAVSAFWWLVAHKVRGTAAAEPAACPAETLMSLQRAGIESVTWSGACVTGRASRLSANLRGCVVASGEGSPRLFFVRHGWSTPVELSVTGLRAARDPRNLGTNVIVFDKGGRAVYRFLFPGGDEPAQRLIDAVRVQEPARDLVAA